MKNFTFLTEPLLNFCPRICILRIRTGCPETDKGIYRIVEKFLCQFE